MHDDHHEIDVLEPRRMSTFHRTKLMFLAASFASLVLSVGLWFSGSTEAGLFVGLWVPAIHSLGTLVLTGEEELRHG